MPSNQFQTEGTYLNLQRVMEMVWRDGLLSKSFGLGLRGRSLHCIRTFLGNRTARIHVGTCFSNWFEVQNGLVQGSVISPISFSVMINDLPEGLQSKTALYADDAALRESRIRLDAMSQVMQNDLNTISSWCNKRGLRISNKKTNLYK